MSVLGDFIRMIFIVGTSLLTWYFVFVFVRFLLTGKTKSERKGRKNSLGKAVIKNGKKVGKASLTLTGKLLRLLRVLLKWLWWLMLELFALLGDGMKRLRDFWREEWAR